MLEPAGRRVAILRFRASCTGFGGKRGMTARFLRGICFGRLFFLRANVAFDRGGMDGGMQIRNRFVGGASSSNILRSIVIENSKQFFLFILRLFQSFRAE